MWKRFWEKDAHEEQQKQLDHLKKLLDDCDAVVIGAGSGLSTAAGYTYSGEKFDYYFGDFRDAYGIQDMYSGGFYPFPDMETFWAWWSRHIWLNRYAPIPNDVYEKLLELVKEKDYFVITTNVDHCFQRSGFDKKRLFYTQGDYGLLQSSHPQGDSAHKTYENEEIIRKMVLAQGFEIANDGELIKPDGKRIAMDVPTELVPYCTDDGQRMTTNLRCDNTFVEDSGWHKAAERYNLFLQRHSRMRTLYLELGVGFNTPGIIKYRFWQLTAENRNATYVCLNKGQSGAPKEIADRSLCIDSDIYEVVHSLQKLANKSCED